MRAVIQRVLHSSVLVDGKTVGEIDQGLNILLGVVENDTEAEADILASKINAMLNGSRFYGLGELELYSVKRFAPVTDYQGKVMTFHAKEFNRPSPNTKPIPSNRKKG